jgi:flagellar biogenesis protein FliO
MIEFCFGFLAMSAVILGILSGLWLTRRLFP